MAMVIRRSLIIAAVVLLLGLISVGAGLAAEFIKTSNSDDYNCAHQNILAMALAITAVVALVLIRVVVRVAIGQGYACCRTHPDVPKLIRYCIFIAWLMSFAAVGQFIAGAKLCSQTECHVLNPGLFSSAAFEALVSLGLTLFYYLVIASTQNNPTKPPASELEAPSAMSYPIPPTMQ